MIQIIKLVFESSEGKKEIVTLKQVSEFQIVDLKRSLTPSKKSDIRKKGPVRSHCGVFAVT